jgi:hypothetical protein
MQQEAWAPPVEMQFVGLVRTIICREKENIMCGVCFIYILVADTLRRLV